MALAPAGWTGEQVSPGCHLRGTTAKKELSLQSPTAATLQYREVGDFRFCKAHEQCHWTLISLGRDLEKMPSWWAVITEPGTAGGLGADGPAGAQLTPNPTFECPVVEMATSSHWAQQLSVSLPVASAGTPQCAVSASGLRHGSCTPDGCWRGDCHPSFTLP